MSVVEIKNFKALVLTSYQGKQIRLFLEKLILQEN